MIQKHQLAEVRYNGDHEAYGLTDPSFLYKVSFFLGKLGCNVTLLQPLRGLLARARM